LTSPSIVSGTLTAPRTSPTRPGSTPAASTSRRSSTSSSRSWGSFARALLHAADKGYPLRNEGEKESESESEHPILTRDALQALARGQILMESGAGAAARRGSPLATMKSNRTATIRRLTTMSSFILYIERTFSTRDAWTRRRVKARKLLAVLKLDGHSRLMAIDAWNL
jgi:hypothetical protein